MIKIQMTQMTEHQFDIMMERIIPTGLGHKSMVKDQDSLLYQMKELAKQYGYIINNE